MAAANAPAIRADHRRGAEKRVLDGAVRPPLVRGHPEVIVHSFDDETVSEIVIPTESPSAELKTQPRVAACRFDKSRGVTRGLEGLPDMLGDLRQRGGVASGKVQVLRWTVQELMRPECIPSG